MRAACLLPTSPAPMTASLTGFMFLDGSGVLPRASEYVWPLLILGAIRGYAKPFRPSRKGGNPVQALPQNWGCPASADTQGPSAAVRNLRSTSHCFLELSRAFVIERRMAAASAVKRFDGFKHRQAGVLRAAIGMVDDTWSRSPPHDRHREGVDDKIRLEIVAHGPAHDLTAEHVHHGGQEEPPIHKLGCRSGLRPRAGSARRPGSDG